MSKRGTVSAAADVSNSKWDDADAEGGLRYLKARFPEAEAWQLSAVGKKDYQTREGVRVSRAIELLKRFV